MSGRYYYSSKPCGSDDAGAAADRAGRAARWWEEDETSKPKYTGSSNAPKTETSEERFQRHRARRAQEDADRQRAEDDARRMRTLSFWEYAALWQKTDRAVHGAMYDAFSRRADAFIKDNSRSFPTLENRNCARDNCVRGEKLGVCHHVVEMFLRGSGCFDEKWAKKQRIRWHPDRWTGKGEAQALASEMFQLIGRVLDTADKK